MQSVYLRRRLLVITVSVVALLCAASLGVPLGKADGAGTPTPPSSGEDQYVSPSPYDGTVGASASEPTSGTCMVTPGSLQCDVTLTSLP